MKRGVALVMLFVAGCALEKPDTTKPSFDTSFFVGTTCPPYPCSVDIDVAGFDTSEDIQAGHGTMTDGTATLTASFSASNNGNGVFGLHYHFGNISHAGTWSYTLVVEDASGWTATDNDTFDAP